MYRLLIILFSFPLILISGTFTTTGTPGTWAEGGAPGADDDLVIDHDWSTYNSSLGYSFGTVRGSVTINSGGYFKVAGSMVVRGNANVEIASGGSLEVTGSLDINGGGSGTFNFDGSIDTDGAVINGAGITGTGTWTYASTFTNNGDINGFTGVPASPIAMSTLPVEWLSFEAIALNDNEHVLQWSTASEINNDFFQIERSYNGSDFEPIGTVRGFGNSSIAQHYNFTDDSFDKRRHCYYRIKQVDFDDQFDYSKTVSIFQPIEMLVYFNSSTNSLVINSNSNLLSQINVFDVNGKLLYKKVINSSSDGRHEIVITDHTIQLFIVSLVHQDFLYTEKIMRN